MRVLPALIFLAFSPAFWAQSPDDALVVAARAELERLQSMVDAGALPRSAVEKAREAVADAQDAAIIRTAASPDLNLEQADEITAAAQRRVARREKALEDAKQLVLAGAAAKASLLPLIDDLEHERQSAQLAELRGGSIRELADMANAEANLINQLAHSSEEAAALAEGYHADGTFLYATYAKVEMAYRERFGKSMPVSALGETAVHRAMGFDHRGRVDVALNPDQPEGVWLIEYLKQNRIPFFAFRGAVKGKATGAHIHIGPMSTRLPSGG